MNTATVFVVFSIISIAFYFVGYRRSLKLAGGREQAQTLHSRPNYYGLLVALWCFTPAFILFFTWQALDTTFITRMLIAEMPEEFRSLPAERIDLLVNEIRNHAAGRSFTEITEPAIQQAVDRYRWLQEATSHGLWIATIGLALLGALFGLRKVRPKYRARNQVERYIKATFIICSSIAIFTTIGIVLSVLFEAMRFFSQVPITDFLFGLSWSPQMAIRADQVGSTGAFGAIPVFAGTFLISAIAMLVAVPIGLMSAIYLSEYASKRVRALVKPVMEILAGVPTVVYGFFAALMVAPFIRQLGESMGLNIASESALAAGGVMGIMIIPFVSSLSDDAINSVPMSLREGSLALGATNSETVRKVVLPAALPGIVGGILLAVSRAIGETMIVVMAAGLAANLTANPFEAVTTVTVQIVTLLIGDQEFDSPKTLAAFALGLVLFFLTLVLNIIALVVVRKYREQYE
jgi:phosphate transport system permease protein